MDREKHREVIDSFLGYMNDRTDHYILKGGTSLMECYNLDRFSEDIDLDSTDRDSIDNIIQGYCKEHGYEQPRLAKDTPTVKRYFIHYETSNPSGEVKPLKVEVSFRSKLINPEEVCKINGISVYSINRICQMKCSAYNSRDKIRDLYDIVYIYREFKDELSPTSIDTIGDAFSYKGIEYVDYLLSDQKDDLIDKDKLASDFLDVYNDLGLLSDDPIETEDLIDDVEEDDYDDYDPVD